MDDKSKIIKNYIDTKYPKPEEDKDWEDKAMEYASSALEKVEPVLKVLGYPGGLVRGSLAGLAETATGRDDLVDINDVLKGNAPSSAEIMEKLGVSKGKSLSDVFPSMYTETGKGLPLQKGGLFDPSARGVAGLAVDVVTDPLTYLMGGAAKGATATAEAVEEASPLLKNIRRVLTDERGSFDLSPKTPIPEPTQILPGIYSKAEKTILDRMGRSAKPEQIYNEVPVLAEDGTQVLNKDGTPKVTVGGLLHSAQVKPEEIQFLKIPEFLKGKDVVTKEELLAHIKENLPKLEITEFDRYHSMGSHYIPGKTSFKGVQYDAALPKEIEQEIFDQLKSYDPKIAKILNEANVLNLREIQNNPELSKTIKDYFQKQLEDIYTQKGNEATKLSPLPTYAAIDTPPDGDLQKIKLQLFADLFSDTSHYGDSPNIIGHYRSKLTAPDYPGQEGPALSAHEIQSQWHHQGAQKGYLTQDESIKAGILNKKLKPLRKKEDQLSEVWTQNRLKTEEYLINNGVSETDYYDNLDKIRERHNYNSREYMADPEYKKLKNEYETKKAQIKSNEEYQKLKQNENASWNELERYRSENIYPLIDQIKKIQGSLLTYDAKVPYAPLKGDAIYELLAKLHLLDAAKADAGRIIWPTAKTQAKRYPSGSQIGNLNKIEVLKTPEGHYQVKGFPADDEHDVREFLKTAEKKPYTDANIDVVLPKEYQQIIKSTQPVIDEAGNKKWIIEGGDLYLGAKRFRKIYDDIQTKLYRNIGLPYKQEPYLHLEPGSERAITTFPHSPDYNMILTPEMKKDLLKKGLPLWVIPFLMNQEQEEDTNEKNKFSKLKKLFK